eukprot:1190970-Prorocentrum_minimum.AAC.2
MSSMINQPYDEPRPPPRGCFRVVFRSTLQTLHLWTCPRILLIRHLSEAPCLTASISATVHRSTPARTPPTRLAYYYFLRVHEQAVMARELLVDAQREVEGVHVGHPCDVVEVVVLGLPHLGVLPPP